MNSGMRVYMNEYGNNKFVAMIFDCSMMLVFFYFQFDLSKMNTVSTRLDMDRLAEFNRKHIQRHLRDPRLKPQLIDDVRSVITQHLHSV